MKTFLQLVLILIFALAAHYWYGYLWMENKAEKCLISSAESAPPVEAYNVKGERRLLGGEVEVSVLRKNGVKVTSKFEKQFYILPSRQDCVIGFNVDNTRTSIQ